MPVNEAAEGAVFDPLVQLSSARFLVRGLAHGSHIKAGPQCCPATPDRPSASHLAAVTAERCHPDQGGSLPTGEEAELGQLGQQGPCAHGSDARHRAEQLRLGAPDRAIPDRPVEVALDLGQSYFQPAEVGVDPLVQSGFGGLTA